MNYDNKNFILAIVLSMLIVFGWQYFYVGPITEKQKQQASQQQTTQPATQGETQAPAPESSALPALLTREEVLKSTPRIKIETPFVSGSINLQGAQIDDLHLIRYRETIDSRSPTIVFLSPAGTPGALFAEQGFVAAAGTTAKLPGPKTVWTAPANTVLGSGKPVNLTWDNGEGLLFTRVISIDDEYLFTVTQTVTNTTATAVALVPYGRVQRQETPQIAGWWVFFEGMLGVFDGTLREVNYSDQAETTEPTRYDSTGGWLGFTDK